MQQLQVETDVRAFTKKYGLPIPLVPIDLSEEDFEYRYKFMMEELEEMRLAYLEGDREDVFDAIIDLVYVAIGTAILMGLNFSAGWLRVQYANMQKVRVENIEDSKRKHKWDVIKPPGWKSPSLKDLV